MSFLGGLLVGVLLGSLLGMLLAPSSGAATRRQIADRSEASKANDGAYSPLNLPMALVGAVARRISEARRGAGQAAAEEKARLAAEWARTKRGS